MTKPESKIFQFCHGVLHQISLSLSLKKEVYIDEKAIQKNIGIFINY